MKRFALVMLCLALTIPVLAGGKRAHRWNAVGDPVVLQVYPLSPETAARLVHEAEAVRLRTQSIANNSSTRAFAIPAAGSVQGQKGTFFKSDVTLVNWNETNQAVGVVWYPQGASQPSVFGTTFPGNRPPFTIQDFVGQGLLKQSGLGSLLFFPIDAAGQFDENGAIDGYSRIWTPQPNATGTVSQPFGAVDITHMMGEYEGFILGLRTDSNYRTNYGIVNMSDRALPFTVTVFPESAAPGTNLPESHVTVPAQGMVQGPIPAGLTGPVNLLISIDTDQPDDTFTWTSYASSTDNITGDGWVSIVTKDYDDDALDTAGIAGAKR